MNYIFDELGYQGPLILTTVVGLKLLDQTPFFAAYFVGYWLNVWLNEFLKSVIKEPRPIPIDLLRDQKRDPFRFLHEWFSGEENKLYISRAHFFGMPSGHAQMSSFALYFFYLVREKRLRLFEKFDNETLQFGLMIFIFCVTLFQRWSSKAHSVNQLMIGTFVGCCFAWIVHFCVTWYKRIAMKNLKD